MPLKDKPSVFISYSGVESDDIKQLRKHIERLELHVSDDATFQTASSNWRRELERALRRANIYLFFISPKGLDSAWTNFEMGVAAARASDSSDVTVIPVLRDGAKWDDIPAVLRRTRGIDANKMSASELAEKLKLTLEGISEKKVG